MIYFTSDLHFGHSKDFLWQPRGFNSSQEHDLAILKNFNDKVIDTDDVYILGDLMLENNDYGLNLIKQLHGHLHIIIGNHDTNSRIELYKQLPNVVEITYATIIKIGKQSYYLSHYPTYTANYDDKPYHNHLINLHGHTHSKNKFFNDNLFMYNIALDAHENYPISIEEIDQDIHQEFQKIYLYKVKGDNNEVIPI